MKKLSEEKLKFLHCLIDGHEYPEFGKIQPVFHTHIIERCDVPPSISVMRNKDAARPSIYSPPSLLVTSGLIFHTRMSTLYAAVWESIYQRVQHVYNLAAGVDPELPLVIHVLLLDAHTVYKATMPEYVRIADAEGVSIPMQPTYKSVAVEIALIALRTENVNEFEFVHRSGDHWVSFDK
jgi:hypothetical protein